MIKNKLQLIENGSNILLKKLRADACDILEIALSAVDPERAMEKALRLENEVLIIEKDSIDLKEIDRIFVIGGGKAGGLMSRALEKLLGERITSGVVNVLEGTEQSFSLFHINLIRASHPIPSQSGVEGVRRMLKLTEGLKENDLVITLISGGGSAMMPFPAESINLDNLQDITSRLLRAGATINELNVVRKHLSAFKGGQLARHCSPARVLSLILSDVINDPLDIIASGPTVPDTSTFEGALEVLEKYRLYHDAPKQVKQRINAGINGLIPETPKKEDLIFNRVSTVLIANNLLAAKAANEMAKKIGYNSIIFSTNIEGEAKEVGAEISDLVKNIIQFDHPLSKPAAVIFGGETTVTVKGSGKGGRNQELALGAGLNLKCNSCLVATLGTDGIDGPTEAAGAIVDGKSMNRAKEKGMDPIRYLVNNDSYSFFSKINDNIITGPTGTNVNDIVLILIV